MPMPSGRSRNARPASRRCSTSPAPSATSAQLDDVLERRRPHDRRVARLPGRGGQPLPAGLERLRGHHRARLRPRRATSCSARRGGWESWEPLLDDRFRGGAPTSSRPGSTTGRDDLLSFTPDIAVSDDPDAWHPDDALFVPLQTRRRPPARASSRWTSRCPARARGRGAGGAGRRRRARRAGARERRRRPRPTRATMPRLEQLLRVSSRLTESLVDRRRAGRASATGSRARWDSPRSASTCPTRLGRPAHAAQHAPAGRIESSCRPATRRSRWRRLRRLLEPGVRAARAATC